MNTCLTHNQQYDPRAGGYCPYCGVPVVQQVGGYTFQTITAQQWVRCDNCGQSKPLYGPHTCTVSGEWRAFFANFGLTAGIEIEP